MQKILLVVLMLFTSLLSSDEPIECQQQNVLAKYTGHYSNTKLWNDIPKERNWALTNEQLNTEIISIDINEQGGITAYTNWHEGALQPT